MKPSFLKGDKVTKETQNERRQKHKGWRTIGGKTHYFKSLWEANYARFLQWLKEQGKILDWEYEPDTFWFERIKRGVNNYTPDFKITHLYPVKHPDGRKSTIEYVEVKGYMDSKSATKIKRMGIYHKEILLRVVDQAWFSDKNRFYRNLIPGWESPSKD